MRGVLSIRKRLSLLCLIAGFVLLASCDDHDPPGIRVVRLENMTIVHHVDSVRVSGAVMRGKITNDGRDTTYTDTTLVHNLVITQSEIQSEIHKEEVGEIWEELLTYLVWDLAHRYMDTLETKTETDTKDEK